MSQPGDGAGRSIEAEYEYQSTLATLDLSEGVALPVGRDARYVIRALVGRGAMGVVYRADDVALRRSVAIKVVAGTSQAHLRQLRLQREAWALALLEHPNVVPVYDVDRAASGELFVVMRYVPGETLRSWQQRAEPSDGELVAAYLAAGRGLAAAHARGLLHRDFKPANVMVMDGDEGRPRVLVGDFGLASGASLLEHQESPASVAVTEERAGTPAYMAPEQLAGEAIDARADQYAFCVALWEALAGERPVDVEGRPWPPPRPARIPRWIDRALRRGLARDAARRHPDMEALLETLASPPSSRGWRVAVTAAAFAGMAAWALWPRALPDPCAPVDAELAQVWNPERHDELRGTLSARALFGAQSQARRVVRAADLYAERWRESRRALCEAPRDDLEAKNALRAHRDALDTFDHQLAFIEDHVSESSSAGLEELATRWLLTAPASLAQTPLMPELRSRLVEIEGYQLLGELHTADNLARAANDLAREGAPCREGHPYRAELAATQLRVGHIRLDQGHPGLAIAAFESSSEHARACGAHEYEVQAQLQIARLRAQEFREPHGAHAALRLADAGLAILEEEAPRPLLRFEHHLTAGVLAIAAHAWPEALEAFERAEALVARDAPLLAARARNARGSALQRAEDLEGAREAYGAAAQMLLSRELDPRDPALARQWAYPSYNRCSLAIAALQHSDGRGYGGPYLAARSQCMEAVASVPEHLRLALEIELLRLDIIAMPTDAQFDLSASSKELDFVFRAKRLAFLARTLPRATPRHRAIAMYWSGRALDRLGHPDRLQPLAEALELWDQVDAEAPMRDQSALLLGHALAEQGLDERARVILALLRDRYPETGWMHRLATLELAKIEARSGRGEKN